MLGSLSTAAGSSRWADRIVTAGLVLVVVLTPLASGVAQAGSLVLMEVAIFALVIVWMLKEASLPSRIQLGKKQLWRVALPAAALLCLLALQLLPIPAPVLRVASPTTYRIYQLSFPGWPRESPYRGLASIWGGTAANSSSAAAGLPPADVTDRKSRHAPAGPTARGLAGLQWRTLSLAPAVTASGLIEALALGAVFFLVVLYPVGIAGEVEAESRFYRALIFAVLAAATSVAIIGLAQQAWGAPRGDALVRASGPFVNADHFANFLVMALPLAVAGAVFPIAPVPRRWRADARFFFAASAFVTAVAVVLSLSRGGWIAGAFGVCVTLALGFMHAQQHLPELVRRLRIGVVPLSLGAFFAVLLLVLCVIGPEGRTDFGARAATIAQRQDISAKSMAWRPTLGLIADFPLFGVGLGCWPEIFPRYQRPPWLSIFFFSAAENDYLQFTAEAGLAGLALLVWFCYRLAETLRHGAQRLPPRQWPLFAGLIAGAGAAMLHEALDFSFHRPTNVLLFTVLLALALRLALTEGADPRESRPSRVAATVWRTYLPVTCTAAAALALIVAACGQENDAYPYNIGGKSLAQVEVDLMAHPAMSAAHLALVTQMPEGAPVALREGQLRAAVWLDPNDPRGRDLYARTLLLAGKQPDALQQILLSIYHAPRLDAHYYLAPGLIPWLLTDEQSAIADGFSRAVAAQLPNSVDEFAEFYGQLGRYRDAAELYARAARRADSEEGERFGYLLVKAGRNYALAGDGASATKVLREAEKVDPSDPKPYIELVESVFGPAGDVGAARMAAEQGIRHGVDPYRLEMALAAATEKAGDKEAAAQALEQAFRYEPKFEAAMQLGNLYLSANRLERAVLTLQQATELRPNSAEAFYALGQAQEASFDYAEAAKAYARAVALAPRSELYRSTYTEFERRTAEAAKATTDAHSSGIAASVPPSTRNGYATVSGEKSFANSMSGATPALGR